MLCLFVDFVKMMSGRIGMEQKRQSSNTFSGNNQTRGGGVSNQPQNETIVPQKQQHSFNVPIIREPVEEPPEKPPRISKESSNPFESSGESVTPPLSTSSPVKAASVGTRRTCGESLGSSGEGEKEQEQSWLYRNKRTGKNFFSFWLPALMWYICVVLEQKIF